MKTFRKIEFNSSKLNHEEMKNVKGGFYGPYGCTMSTSGVSSIAYSCSSYASSCMKETGSIGNCTITITAGPFQYVCRCE